MPEAPPDLYNSRIAGEYDVWSSGKPVVVQSVAESIRMEISPHSQFRLGISATDTGHHPASYCFRNAIGHALGGSELS